MHTMKTTMTITCSDEIAGKVPLLKVLYIDPFFHYWMRNFGRVCSICKVFLCVTIFFTKENSDKFLRAMLLVLHVDMVGFTLA